MPIVRLTKEIFEEFYPDIHDDAVRIHRKEKKAEYSSIEEIPQSASLYFERDDDFTEAEDYIGWSKDILLKPCGKFEDYIPNREDTVPFFQVSAEDICNGKNEDAISVPTFISFAKCERKRF